MKFKFIRETGTFVDIYLMAQLSVEVTDKAPEQSSIFES